MTATLPNLPHDWDQWPPEAKHRLLWRLEARPEQLTPGTEGALHTTTDWNIWLIMSGRGWGKTRTGAEDFAYQAWRSPGWRFAVVARSFGDARDVCMEGESGLLNVLPRESIEAWNRSMGELRLVNGSQFKIFSGDEPEKLRGPQHHRAWCDELAAWNYPQETWDMLTFGLRLGAHPQVIVTTTPKPIPIIRKLVERGRANPRDVLIQTGSTFENAKNLSPIALAEMRKRYEGTRLGRQELYAEILDEIEGALWSHELLDRTRMSRDWLPRDLIRVTVAIDPAISVGENADETGIIVAAKAFCRKCNSPEPHAFVLHDGSLKKALPETWARQAVKLYHHYKADRLVPEKNQGGEMVTLTIKTADRHVNVRPVVASRGKTTRAEPVSALYEQGKVHHVGLFPELEDQMCTWDPDPEVNKSLPSPDRMDALVYAITDLMLTDSQVRFHDRGTMRDRRLTGRR